MSDHYFSESPASDLKPREIDAVLGGEPRSVLTSGGVFSPEHLDRGTEVLLHTLQHLREQQQDGNGSPTHPSGAVLDLGCGWGPIALSAALAEPHREVWAIDVNERARELTATNAERLGLSNVRVVAPDEVPTALRFAQIHSNPPIRVGKKVLHEMLAHWLPRLAPGGTAYLVVAKHLGADSLQKWINAEFDELEVTRVARNKGFHVIEVTRPI